MKATQQLRSILVALSLIFVLVACSSSVGPSPSAVTREKSSQRRALSGTLQPSFPASNVGQSGTTYSPVQTSMSTSILATPSATRTVIGLLPTSVTKQSVSYSGRLRVISKEETDVSGQVFGVSPDGQWIAGENRDEDAAFCVYRIGSQKHLCASGFDGSVDPQSVSWSPDSTKVAFTQNFVRFLQEPDIWVLDITTGKAHDLTNDGLASNASLHPEKHQTAKVDLAPTWSPDGKQVYFARSLRRVGKHDIQATDIYKTSIRGSKPEKMAQVSQDIPYLIYTTMHWASDDKTLYASGEANEPGSPASGVYSINTVTGKVTMVVKSDKRSLFQLMDVSPSSKQAIVMNDYAVASFSSNGPFLYLADLRNGRLSPLRHIPAKQHFGKPLNATFSPGGKRVAYVYMSGQDKWVLAIRDVPGGKEQILATTKASTGFNGLYEDARMSWTTNNTIWVPTSPSGGTIFYLRPAGK